MLNPSYSIGSTCCAENPGADAVVRRYAEANTRQLWFLFVADGIYLKLLELVVLLIGMAAVLMLEQSPAVAKESNAHQRW